MELKILFQNTSYLMITRVVKFVVGFVRSKLIAVFLGVSGTGIIMQITQMTEEMARFTSSGMNDGLVKEIAESNKDKVEYKKNFAVFIKSYITVISVSILLVFSVSFYFSKSLTIYFLGDSKYFGYFLIVLISFPILNINGVSFAILKSYKEIKYIARGQLAELIINLIIFIPLVYIWGLTGAVVYVTFAWFVILLVNHYYAQTVVLHKIKVTVKDIFKARISRKVIRELFVFASYGLTAGVAQIFTDSATRVLVVTKLGIHYIGIYSPVIMWTSLFSGLIRPSISTYLYPRFCECKTNLELTVLMNDCLRFITLLMIPFVLLSIPLRYVIIPLFYSREFRAAGNYLPWHFLGSLFFMWMFVFDLAMKPTGRITRAGIIVIIMCLIDLVVVYTLIPVIGLYGYMLRYLISPVLAFFYYYVFWTKAIKFKLQLKNLLLMGYLVTAIFLIMIIEKTLSSNYRYGFLSGLSLTLISYLVLSRQEKYFITEKFRKTYLLLMLRMKPRKTDATELP